MLSLDETFEALKEILQAPDALNPARADPLFYFLHRPDETLTVAHKLPVWKAALETQGLTVEHVSLARIIHDLIDASGRWDQWLQLESRVKPAAVNNSVRDVLQTNNALVTAVGQHLCEPRPDTVVFITDAILMHPFFRAHGIESSLTDRIKVPTVLFYPGRRAGQFGLHFLDFYPVDGNYRATIVGGTA